VQTYVLKLNRSGEDGEKALLLLESGTRFHTVEVCCELHYNPTRSSILWLLAAYMT
jgi:hypothetical protein